MWWVGEEDAVESWLSLCNVLKVSQGTFVLAIAVGTVPPS